MSGTALDHPLIRDYLRRLDAALAGSSAGQARELREQITDHLQDALPAGAGDQEVTVALARLGSPAGLAAESGGAMLAPPLAAQSMRRLRAALSRRTWRFWATATATVILAGIVTSYVAAVQTAGVLQVSLAAGWWYPQDRALTVYTTADGASQVTVPIRPGQRQGFFVDINNPSDWTQTVLGPAYGWQSPGSPFAQVGVSPPGSEQYGLVANPYSVRYSLPGTIPPHQWRALRVTWISRRCLPKGAAEGIDRLILRVRIGWNTRTEVIPLGQGWYLSGTSQSRCG
ncbi:MAG: HAAS signaling domain-containing protein [Streptosporangiaceae bacterium]